MGSQCLIRAVSGMGRAQLPGWRGMYPGHSILLICSYLDLNIMATSLLPSGEPSIALVVSYKGPASFAPAQNRSLFSSAGLELFYLRIPQWQEFSPWRQHYCRFVLAAINMAFQKEPVSRKSYWRDQISAEESRIT